MQPTMTHHDISPRMGALLVGLCILVPLLASLAAYINWNRLQTEINAIHQDYLYAKQRYEALSAFRGGSGYSGFITHYKNYLAHDRSDNKARLLEHHARMRALAPGLQGLFESPEDRQALATIMGTLDAYLDSVPAIETAWADQLLSRAEMDRHLILDGPAQQALDRLEQRVRERLGETERQFERLQDKSRQFFNLFLGVGLVVSVLAAAFAFMYIHGQRTQRRLRNSARRNEQMQLLLDQSTDAFIAADERGIIIDLNQPALRMFGYQRRDELLQQPVALLMNDQDAAQHHRFLRNYLDSGKVNALGMSNRPFLLAKRKDGSLFPALIRLSGLRTDQGWLFSTLISDVSGIKEREDRIIRQARNLAVLKDISTHRASSLVERIDHALGQALALMQLDTGIVSQIEGDRYRIDFIVAPDSLGLSPKQEFPLSDTPCAKTLNLNDITARPLPADAAGAGPRDVVPFRGQMSRSAYIGAPYAVDGQVRGTITLSSSIPVHRAFSEDDFEFMRMLAAWLGATLEQDLLREQQRISEERLGISQGFAKIGTWDWNIQNGDLFWSPQIPPLFGYAKGALETSYANFIQAVHPDDRQRVQQAVNACVAQGAEYNIEHRVVWPDGSVHWLHELGDVQRTLDGTPLHMLGVVRDITLNKMYEEHLALFRRVFDRTDQGIGLTDPHGLLIYVNRAYSTLLDYPEEELIGKDFTSLIAPEGAEQMQAAHEALSHGMGWIGNIPLRSSNGRVFPSASNFGVILNDNNQSQHLFHLFADFTPELKRRQELQERREEAERANRAKSEFLSSMSHELRTPMNAIIGFGQLLEIDGTLSEEQQENIGEILKASHHLLELINEVLDLSKIESGRVSLSMEPVPILRTLEEALTLILPLAAKRAIQIDNRCQEDLLVIADAGRCKQVLLNLLSNAVKYSQERGAIEIEATREPDDWLRLRISDNGQGITEAQMQELFHPFQRLGMEGSNIEGTGIGLVITKQLVELMGGRIGVESNPGQGSTFWFSLRLAPGPAMAAELINSEPSRPDLGGQGAGCQCKVLYLEDNPSNLKLVRQILARLPSIELLTSQDPLLGLELAQLHQPDLILLDINMPVLDGYAILRQLRQQDWARTTPVIALTANAMAKDRERGMAAGFNDYLTKPLDIPRFMEAIDRQLAGKQLRAISDISHTLSDTNEESQRNECKGVDIHVTR